jgi:hypothetical protein
MERNKVLHTAFAVTCIIMKRMIITLFFFTGIVTSLHAQVSVENEVRLMEEKERKAILSQDTMAMSKIWDETLLVNSPLNIVVDKSGGLSALSNGLIHYSTYVKFIEKIALHGNMAIVMGMETVIPTGKAGDAGKTVKRRYTNIWLKNDDVWTLIARHANNISVE